MSIHHTPLPWKKAFRKVPPPIAAVLAACPATVFAVGCVQRLRRADIERGSYRHVCISATDAAVALPPAGFVPSPNVGPASFANAIPVEEQVKALGKVPKRIRGRAPNWQGAGSHATTYVREVWFTRLAVPAMTPLWIEPAGAASAEEVPVRFRLGEALVRADPAFDAALLRALNLLQENVGAVGLIPLAPGEAAGCDSAAEDLGWAAAPVVEMTAEARRRLEVLARLSPRRLWFSTRGLTGAVLAEFTAELTVFSHLEATGGWLVLRGAAPVLPALTRSALRDRFTAGGEWIGAGEPAAARLRDLVLAARGEFADGQIALW